jgi:hypothetical protein
MADLGAELTELEQHGIGPFTTHRRLRRADGHELEYSAWHHRKGHGLVDPAQDDGREVQWWAPRRRGWWIAVLFIIGSACFAVGAFPPTASLLGAAAAYVFFIGSVFFTSAAYLQYYEATNEGDELDGSGRTGRLAGVRATSLGWWATAIQLIGTVAFNVSTFAALLDLSTLQEEALMWAPDMVGSACFLVASALVIMETHDRIHSAYLRSLESRIAVINMAGSVAFGFSAIAAFVVPTTGELANIAVVNAGTFIGALCFLVGAVMLIPDMRPEPAATPEAAA